MASHKYTPSGEHDLLVIDECSTVSNADLLEETNFKLLVLVGDVFQIESIRFGNSCNVIRSYLPQASVLELTTPYRTRSDALVDLWTKVLTLDEGIAEAIARNGYSTALDATLFSKHSADDILALNYDCLCGINNINRFLQAGNSNPAVPWGPASFKAGDPVLFDGHQPLQGAHLQQPQGHHRRCRYVRGQHSVRRKAGPGRHRTRG